MASVKNGLQKKDETSAPQVSIATMVNSLLDKDGYKKRFDELLGKRAPQFVASIVSLVNTDANMKAVFAQSPVTIIQAALKAATYDLPVDPSLGYAYIVPFNNYDKDTKTKRMEAVFVMGYKGMLQLANRTGAYKKINVVDVREGELINWDRLTEDFDFEWIQDEKERNVKPIIGWAGYFRLVNGAEKTIYMSKAEIEAHEVANRKGQYMGKGWRENFEAMAAKTVLRKLIGKWGLMSIDYRTADTKTVEFATAIAKGEVDDLDAPLTLDGATGEILDADTGVAEIPEREVDPDTGELIPLDLK